MVRNNSRRGCCRVRRSFLRSSRAIRAENLVVRKQLAVYIERGIKPRRVDHVTRVSLALFSRLFDWRDAVVTVRPSTIVQAVCDIVQTATESAGYNLTCGALFFKKRMCQTYS